MATFTADTKQLANRITLKVTFRRNNQWLWRVRLASWLIRLAAWVMWVNVRIEVLE